ncbi:MAG: DinB family protein [Chitinophagaceae bacterium]
MNQRKKSGEKPVPGEGDPMSKTEVSQGNDPGKIDVKTMMTKVAGSREYSFEQIGAEMCLAFEREFQITVWKDVKRKKILLQVNETGKSPSEYLPQFDIEYKVADTEVPLNELPGHAAFLSTIKDWIHTYANTTVDHVKDFLWSQFGASIDMVKNAITLWPEDKDNPDTRFFYNAYHALLMLDYYLSDPSRKFTSPLPFTFADPGAIPEGVIGDMLPDRLYSKTELLGYADQLRNKCKLVIRTITDKSLGSRWVEKYGDMDYALLEILLYNMRHVQHHAAQLNQLLRQKINYAPTWVFRAQDKL